MKPEVIQYYFESLLNARERDNPPYLGPWFDGMWEKWQADGALTKAEEECLERLYDDYA